MSERYIVDERVGCVAVYKGEHRNCLSGISSDPDCMFYAGGYEVKNAYGNFKEWAVEPEKVEKAKRVAAVLNACQGIPTETLEAGVVVVPVDEYCYMVGSLEEHDEAEIRMGNESAVRTAMLRLANERLSRLQQNGGERE